MDNKTKLHKIDKTWRNTNIKNWWKRNLGLPAMVEDGDQLTRLGYGGDKEKFVYKSSYLQGDGSGWTIKGRWQLFDEQWL